MAVLSRVLRSMRRVRRKNLVQQVAEVIQADIKDGLWSERLPGYRSLQKTYQVGKSTCESALRLLESMGVVAEPEPGLGRRILMDAETDPSSGNEEGTLLVVYDRAHESSHQIFSQLMGACSFWRERGGSLLLKSVDYLHKSNINPLLERWCSNRKPRAILMLLPDKIWLNAALATKLPVFRFGGALSDVHNEGTIISYSALALHRRLFRHLNEMGHRRILYPWKMAVGPIRKDAIRAYEEEFCNCGEVLDPEIAMPLVDFQTHSDWRDYWQTALSTVEPTVVIVEFTMEMVSLMTFCGTKGIRIPRNLSVFLIEGDSLSNWMNPVPSHFSFKDDVELGCFRRWVREGLPNKGMIFHDPNLRETGTVKKLQ